MIAMEGEVAEAQDKLELAREENAQLLGEKSALTDAVKSLNKEVSKLKNFKMNLMATLKDDDQNEFTNDASGDRLVSSVLQSAKPTAMPSPQADGSEMWKVSRASCGYSPSSLSFLSSMLAAATFLKARARDPRRAMPQLRPPLSWATCLSPSGESQQELEWSIYH